MRLDHLLSKEYNDTTVGIIYSRSVGFNLLHCLVFKAYVGFERRGGVAQLGEHLPCKQGVRSSILLISTSSGYRR